MAADLQLGRTSVHLATAAVTVPYRLLLLGGGLEIVSSQPCSCLACLYKEPALRAALTTPPTQVHVMLTAAAPEPHIQRLLASAGATLCSHSVCAAADPAALLPRLDPKWQEPSLRLQLPLASGGQLAEASPGVLLLSSSLASLDAKRAAALGQVVAAGEADLLPGCPELCVPVGATLWTMVHEQGEAPVGTSCCACTWWMQNLSLGWTGGQARLKPCNGLL
jgi:hypothetical protein